MIKANKQAKNLFLDPVAVAQGERYGRLHGTTLSQLVNDFLRSLVVKDDSPRSLLVQRLYGVAAGSKAGRDSYRKHLFTKYGER